MSIGIGPITQTVDRIEADTLFWPGIQGAGKTIIPSVIVDALFTPYQVSK